MILMSWYSDELESKVYELNQGPRTVVYVMRKPSDLLLKIKIA